MGKICLVPSFEAEAFAQGANMHNRIDMVVAHQSRRYQPTTLQLHIIAKLKEFLGKLALTNQLLAATLDKLHHTFWS